VSGKVYTSDFFGMTYEFPKGWSVDQSAIDTANAPRKRGAPTDPNDRRVYDALNAYRDYVLLEVSQHPAHDSRVAGPRIIFAVSTGPDVSDQTVKDLMSQEKRMVSETMGRRLIREPTEYTLGGQKFSRIDVEISWIPSVERHGPVYKSSVATVRQGYLLAFQLFADSREQLDQLFDTLNSLQFSPK